MKMTPNDLNTALYEKMAAEQDRFRDWLKGQPPEEVLHHAYEYTVREDIVMAMEELELTGTQAQALLNQKGRLPAEPVVILGSGDLGLILAGQLSEAGCGIAALVEQKALCGGMARNRRCIEQYRIPLVCSSTVSRVCGGAALEGVMIKNLATGEEAYLPCKSLLIAVGYEPERELVRGLEGAEWLRLCGNCREIHPMIESVITEGKTAGYACVT